MLAADIKIIRQVEDARYDDLGKPQPFIRVEFKVGDHGPFVERIPKPEFNTLTRDAILTAFADVVRTA